MRRYIFRRILLFIPTFIVITLLSFVLLVHAPGNPAERMMTAAQNPGDLSTQSVVQKEQYDYWTHYLGLDLPVFYFGFHSLAEPDTLYKITDKRERDALSELISAYGNWKEIQQYHSSLLKLEKTLHELTCGDFHNSEISCEEFKNELGSLRFEAAAIRFSSQENVIRSKLNSLQTFFATNGIGKEKEAVVAIVVNNYQMIKANECKWKNYLPVISFHAMNQYHRWLFGDGNTSKGLLRGDFGISYLTKQPVSKMIQGRIGWSLFFTFASVFLAYLIGIPIAMKAAANKNAPFDRCSSLVVFMLYSLPAFWVATLLLMTFSNPDVFALFPASGIKPVAGYPVDASFIQKIKLSLPYLILPTICYTYSSFAFLSRTLRVSMLEIASSDYIRTARAKGLSENTVLWKHSLKNSLLPLITVFAGVFPLMIGGSVILESIFTIPGLGSAIYSSIEAQDYPMVIAVFTWTGVLTMIGYLFSDILYAIVDPRIIFSKSLSA